MTDDDTVLSCVHCIICRAQILMRHWQWKRRRLVAATKIPTFSAISLLHRGTMVPIEKFATVSEAWAPWAPPPPVWAASGRRSIPAELLAQRCPVWRNTTTTTSTMTTTNFIHLFLHWDVWSTMKGSARLSKLVCGWAVTGRRDATLLEKFTYFNVSIKHQDLSATMWGNF